MFILAPLILEKGLQPLTPLSHGSVELSSRQVVYLRVQVKFSRRRTVSLHPRQKVLQFTQLKLQLQIPTSTQSDYTVSKLVSSDVIMQYNKGVKGVNRVYGVNPSTPW